MEGKVNSALVRKMVGTALITIPLVGLVDAVPASASTAWHYSGNYTSSAKYYTGGKLRMCDRQLGDEYGPAVQIKGSRRSLTVHGGAGSYNGSLEKCYLSSLRGFHLGSRVRIRVGNYNIRNGHIYTYGSWSGWAKG
jgi:hypothetical protein